MAKTLMDIETAEVDFFWMQEHYHASWKRWILSHGLSFIQISGGKDGKEDYIVSVDKDGAIIHGVTPGSLAIRASEEIIK